MSANRITDRHWQADPRATRGIPFVAEQSLRAQRCLGTAACFVAAASYRNGEDRLRRRILLALVAFIATALVLRIALL